MRVALVAETFMPAVNGVVNSVLRVADELMELGHYAVIVAPSGSGAVSTASGHEVKVVTVPSVSLPGYRDLRIARPGVELRPLLRGLEPDIVHLASPAVLGWAAVQAARSLSIASVAAFQTDLSGYLPRYGVGAGSPALWRMLRRLHNSADLTLVPSTATGYQLRRHGIAPLANWARGVDAELFNPSRRDEAVRRELGAGVGRLLVGYVGRLAAEKRVDLLEPITRVPGVELVIVGDGPRRAALTKAMPRARFAGLRTGTDLATIMASLDVLVHPGANETFCQVVQEALSAGVPVIATASGGPLDLVRHGENGWLWAGDDPDVLAALVASVREDRAGLQVVRGRARDSVTGRSWERATGELIGYYEQVLAARSREPVPLASPARPGRSQTRWRRRAAS